ncbi:MAG: 4Fe-4S ferredoxin, partial [Thermodesulfobacteria bacterium]|nr:4Fe-4S ferredoxin [Thermodesulfobacteriota bacterium]
IVVLLQEGQLKREDLYLVGIPCPGMLDPSKVRQKAPEIKAIEDNLSDEVFIVTSEEKMKFSREELLRGNCRECRHPTPPLYDERIEAPARPPASEPYARVEEIEALDISSRWEWFEKEIVSRCLRCYACRQACPLCYCPTCFVDDSRPQWVGKTRDPVDTALYHLVRAYHLAGRCVDCGSCEAACPMDIPLRLLTKKLEKEALRAFSFEAGLDPEAPLLFTSFSEDDPEDFMLTHELKVAGKI